MNLSFLVSFHRRAVDYVVVAAIPKHHCSCAVIAFGNGAFKSTILDGMILDVHGEPFISLLRRHSFGNSPRFENPLHFKPKIIMKPAGVVFLNDKRQSACLGPMRPTFW